MKIDSHVHLADPSALVPAGSGRRAGRVNLHLRRMIARTFAEEGTPGATGDDLGGRWTACLANWVRHSSLDRAVVLALDAVYDESGHRNDSDTVLSVDNEFVYRTTRTHPELLYGASIHPYRKDAMAALERAAECGACLVKWIPSAQGIDPGNPRCREFYEGLAHFGLPLLSHTGVEHALGTRRTGYNHPRKLTAALEAGVTVIAAHCGVHLFLHEPSYFGAWAKMAKEYPNFHGDLSAFPIMTRVRYARRVFRDEVLRRKVLYGSDFPAMPSPLWCWQLGLKKMFCYRRIRNPLERNLTVMRALGMPDEVFGNATSVFNISPATGRSAAQRTALQCAPDTSGRNWNAHAEA